MLDRAAKAWARVKTTRGSFEQTVTNSLTGSSATARGQFLQQRPNKLAIMFTEPSGDRIVSDGKAVWIYLPSSAPGQVVKRSATDDAAQPMDLVGRFLENPRAKYDIVAGDLQTVGGRAGRQFTLTPKAGTNPDFTKATVWVDTADALIRQFEVVESSGVTRRVRITALDVNAAVDRNAFVFRPPRGVRVLER
jgi:outer membrane lipoprotein carrier protein